MKIFKQKCLSLRVSDIIILACRALYGLPLQPHLFCHREQLSKELLELLLFAVILSKLFFSGPYFTFLTPQTIQGLPVVPSNSSMLTLLLSL